MEALSDGEFAIVATLLVLEIKAPQIAAHDSSSDLAGALWQLAPKFVGWVIGFVTVCVIWLNHHRLFKLMSRIDNGLFCRGSAGGLRGRMISGPRAASITEPDTGSPHLRSYEARLEGRRRS